VIVLLSFCPLFVLIFALIDGQRFGVVIGIGSVLLVVLTFMLSELFKKGEAAQHIQPNQGIWNSIRNMWIGGLLYGLMGGPILGLMGWPAGELRNGLLYGLIGGLLLGLLTYGGDACIQHLALRSLLSVSNHAPFNYARFLDYCHSRILLRKVGGGYIFIHRLLLEHLAAMTEEDIRRLAR
jgi:hypothetical protein